MIFNKVLSRVKFVVHKLQRNLSFIRENKKFWKNNSSAADWRTSILVEISEFNPLELESNLRVAKAIQEKNKSRIFVYSSSKTFFNWYRFFSKSYHIDRYVSDLFFSPQVIFDALQALIYSLVSYGGVNLNSLSNTRFRDVLIGDLLYDSYLRFNENKYSVSKDVSLYKLYFNAVFRYFRASRVLASKQFSYLVIVDKCYIDHGILHRVAIAKNIKVILVANKLKFVRNDNMYKHFMHPEETISTMAKSVKDLGLCLDETISEYFKLRFSGELKQIDVLATYKDKVIYTRNQLHEMFSLNDNNKNAFIMPHAFSDFPHVASGIYEDYYIWLVSLLEIVKSNNTVNWFIKPHPTSYFFGEEGKIEQLVREMMLSNVSIVPSDFSSASLVECADVILTVRGTAGLEYSTFGVPVITAGDGPYSGYGIDIASEDVSQYEKVISLISNIEKLSHEKILKSKLVFYHLIIKKWARPSYLSHMENLKDYNDSLLSIINYNKSSIINDNLRTLTFQLLSSEGQ